MRPPRRVEKIAANRLRRGWDLKTLQPQQQGDVHASYSADRLCDGRPVRKPFTWKGRLWISVGGGPGDGCKIVPLLPRSEWIGETTTYAKKVSIDCGETARNDPNGFYYGMEVKSGGKTYVIASPEIELQPDEGLREMEQLDMFEGVPPMRIGDERQKGMFEDDDAA